MHAKSFDHVALWVDDRPRVATFLEVALRMHEIERTDTFTLLGGDAREGKLTLFDADGPRDRGALERIVFRVPDLEACIERAAVGGFAAVQNGSAAIDGPANVPLGLVPGPEDGVVDLDHVVLGVPDPAATAAALERLGFRRSAERLELESRHVVLRQRPAAPTERPLLNHLALLVDSVEETVSDAEREDVAVDRLVDAPNTLAAFVAGPDEISVEYVEHKPGFALV